MSSDDEPVNSTPRHECMVQSTDPADGRAVNTVLDVGLALLFLGVAVALLTGVPTADEQEHEPLEADRTATVVGSATLNVTYSVEPAVEAARAKLDDQDGGREDEPPQRVSHGTFASHLGAVALANLTVDSETGVRLTRTGKPYQQALDHRVQARLVGSQFDTEIRAEWKPYDGAPVQGTATVGADPPPESAVSSASLTVPGGVEGASDRALDAARTRGSYEAVAAVVADVIVEALVPVRESKHALDRRGVERTLTLYRYDRLSAAFGEAESEIRETLEGPTPDLAAANERLASELADWLAADMANSFDSPRAAATAVSTGEVNIAVRTWTR